MKNKTFAIIKPDAVKNGHTGKIYDRILEMNFDVRGAKLLKMTKNQAGRILRNTQRKNLFFMILFNL